MLSQAQTMCADPKRVNTMISDGLDGYHNGQPAQNVVNKWQINREEQDKFAAASQNKAEGGQALRQNRCLHL